MSISSKITAVSATAGFYLLAASNAFAQQVVPCPKDSQFSNLCSNGTNNIPEVIQRILTLVLIVAVVIALFFLIWGGIRWIMSGGDKGKVETARSTIIGAIVGLIIALLAFFIINVVLQLLGVGSVTGGITLPKILGA
jgi:hypothetical protein